MHMTISCSYSGQGQSNTSRKNWFKVMSPVNTHIFMLFQHSVTGDVMSVFETIITVFLQDQCYPELINQSLRHRILRPVVGFIFGFYLTEIQAINNTCQFYNIYHPSLTEVGDSTRHKGRQWGMGKRFPSSVPEHKHTNSSSVSAQFGRQKQAKDHFGACTVNKWEGNKKRSEW